MTATVIAPLEPALERLREAYPDAVAQPLPDSTVLITVPGLPLPAGWSLSATDVSFIVPVGYPAARLDCFYADAALRLAGGGLPMNASPNVIPHLNENRMWFSWHLATWNPVRDDLRTYVGVIGERLRRAV